MNLSDPLTAGCGPRSAVTSTRDGVHNIEISWTKQGLFIGAAPTIRPACDSQRVRLRFIRVYAPPTPCEQAATETGHSAATCGRESLRDAVGLPRLSL